MAISFKLSMFKPYQLPTFLTSIVLLGIVLHDRFPVARVEDPHIKQVESHNQIHEVIK